MHAANDSTSRGVGGGGEMGLRRQGAGHTLLVQVPYVGRGFMGGGEMRAWGLGLARSRGVLELL